jgi:hypothetical protein
MRDWRKIYKGISVSDKIAKLSMDARWLFVLLILHQDDRGLYHWSRSKMKSLVAGSTEWSANDVQRLIAELENSQLIVSYNTYLEIIDGSDKNGNPYRNRPPLFYDLPEYDLVESEDTTQTEQVSTLPKPKIKNQYLKTKNYNKENNNGETSMGDTKTSRFYDSEIN